MKEFKQDENGLYFCEECDKLSAFKNLIVLSKHTSKVHGLTGKEYFDKWIKDEDEGICKINGCNNETRYKGFYWGYKNTCCKECEYAYRTLCIKKSNMEKYGVENVFAVKKVKEKIVDTIQERYNVDNISKSEFHKKKKEETCLKNNGVKSGLQMKICRQNKKDKLENEPGYKEKINKKVKNTKKERHGDENYNNMQKNKETCMEHFGMEYSFAAPSVRKKCTETCIKLYGVENPSQNPEIHERQLKSMKMCHDYKDTKLHYRGSYELDFLDLYYEKFKDKMINGFRINYFNTIDQKQKWYFSD